MIDRELVEEFRLSNSQLRDQLTDEVEALFDSDLAPQALRVQVEELIRAYGDIASTIAADYYDEMREAQRPVGRAFAALLAAGIADEALRINLSWALKPLSAAAEELLDAGDALGRTVAVADRMALGQGRATLRESARRDPNEPRWARVPTGEETCAFCIMLASRGFVYESERSAGGYPDDAFHDSDDCAIVLSWDTDTPELEGYDPDAYFDKYSEARGIAGSGDPKAILAAMRAAGIASR